ncbi:MAG: glycoside hydrolase, partial [Candidatus Omnitrophota bacterium]
SFASAQTDFWQGYIIPAIRKIYSGKLIYAANWDEYKNIKFWGELDYVGIDAYFSLSQKQSAEYEEIEAGWKKWADEIEIWQKDIGRPIVFTEIGYRSCESAAEKPWDYYSSQPVNLKLQSDCYKAALKTLANRLWCSGFYWWYWSTSPFSGGLNNGDFTPQGKPAEFILSYFYKGTYL